MMHHRMSLLLAATVFAATVFPAHAMRQQKPGQTPQRPGDKVVIETHIVNITVKVADQKGRFVVGLEKENFEVWDNGVRQQIAFFSDEDAPISLGLVYDVSGSMNGLSQQSLSMLRAFFDYTHPEDEFFIMAFNNKPQLVQDFTSVPEEILNRVFYIPPKGSTSLYDAAYLATEKVKQGRHHKKALMIFSDGGENSSRYTSRELRNMLRETDVQIYTVGFGNGGVLEDIVEPTGGLTGFLNSSADAEHYYARLALLLRKQYVIGFYPTDATNKVPWHKVQVKLNAPKQMGPLTLSYRKGYPAF